MPIDLIRDLVVDMAFTRLDQPMRDRVGLHGLGNGHPSGVERVGPPWVQPAGVPAIVVKPRTIAGAAEALTRCNGNRALVNTR